MRIDAYVSDHKKKRKKRRAYLMGGAIFAGVFSVAIGVLWFLIRSPFFELDHIAVSGNTVLATDTVVAVLQSSALADHGFWHSMLGIKNMLIWPDRVPAEDLKFVPQAAAIVTSKDYFANTLDVSVTERNPYAIWCFGANGKCYWFDDQGIIFGRAFSAEGNLIFTVRDDSQKPRGLNQTVLPAEFLPNLLSILKTVRASGLSVGTIELRDLSLEEVNVPIANGPSLLFSLRFPADNYLAVIQSLAKQPGFSKLSYIDCRTENRIYYK